MSSTQLRTQFTTFRPEGFLSAANASEFLERLTVEVKSSVNSALLVNMEAVEFMYDSLRFLYPCYVFKYSTPP